MYDKKRNRVIYQDIYKHHLKVMRLSRLNALGGIDGLHLSLPFISIFNITEAAVFPMKYVLS